MSLIPSLKKALRHCHIDKKWPSRQRCSRSEERSTSITWLANCQIKLMLSDNFLFTLMSKFLRYHYSHSIWSIKMHLPMCFFFGGNLKLQHCSASTFSTVDVTKFYGTLWAYRAKVKLNVVMRHYSSMVMSKCLRYHYRHSMWGKKKCIYRCVFGGNVIAICRLVF